MTADYLGVGQETTVAVYHFHAAERDDTVPMRVVTAPEPREAPRSAPEPRPGPGARGRHRRRSVPPRGVGTRAWLAAGARLAARTAWVLACEAAPAALGASAGIVLGAVIIAGFYWWLVWP